MRKRSKYKPKYAKGTIPVLFRYGQKEETNLQLIPHSELQKFREGTADEYTWNTLAFRLNWGYVMSNDWNQEVTKAMEEALSAVRAVKARHENTGNWGTTGEEFFAIGNGLNFTDEMQKNTTRAKQLEAARALEIVNDYKKLIQG